MKHKTVCTLLCSIVLWLSFAVSASANSSWRWLTKTTPWTLLPFAIVGTLLVETIVLCRVNHITAGWRVALSCLVIVLANVLSFVLPFAILATGDAGIPYVHESLADVLAAIEYGVGHVPYYIVGALYLILTLVVEIPVVMLGLFSFVKNRLRLFLSIMLCNVGTTGLVAVVERLAAQGQW